eukprot:TRINITY_DN897_c3_g1_i5.p1 TRINITY_DN897_c3_g1~~TRINITY_DN897_c3_g1_i5.p1  ORF type:complete len:1290 (-),score=442.72 TRINITY_DN897_c3_g1_i5:648-4265(-)
MDQSTDDEAGEDLDNSTDTTPRSHTSLLLSRDISESETAAEGDQADEEDFVLSQDNDLEEEDDEATLDEEDANQAAAPDGVAGTEELELLAKENAIPIEEIKRKYGIPTQHQDDNGHEDLMDTSTGAPSSYDDEYEDEDGDDDDAEHDGDNNDPQTDKDRISMAARAAEEAQPTGTTLSTTQVKTKVPFLLRGELREYQHIGLDWLVTMYDKKLNGILADEMGLGKTIMTIALLAHLACEREVWGPHLIVVPTSVMLNWEVEFKKWCPAFKILTYYGSPKERRAKRVGWSRPNAFHVCISSYKVVVQDQQAFRRKKWKYFILDEAHNIKNFRSQRWQTLLNFRSGRRLLLTGTPLQNSLMELWSLMHFLMPSVFQSHKEFKDWFSNPVNSMIEGNDAVNGDLISRLHGILRPFLLRRLKKDVEKQLPGKFTHIVPCTLSKRQRYLYEEFIANSDTQATLSSGNFLGIINILMQLRKVCNHPDLFETRPIESPFDMTPILYRTASLASLALTREPAHSYVHPDLFGLIVSRFEGGISDADILADPLIGGLGGEGWELHGGPVLEVIQAREIASLMASPASIVGLCGDAVATARYLNPATAAGLTSAISPTANMSSLDYYKQRRDIIAQQNLIANLAHKAYINNFRCAQRPLYGPSLRKLVRVEQPIAHIHTIAADTQRYMTYSQCALDMVITPPQRAATMRPLLEAFTCIIPRARAPSPDMHVSHPHPSDVLSRDRSREHFLQLASPTADMLRPTYVRQQMYFPDKRLLQYDCGKLQCLAELLRRLKREGHRVLIFTQMTRMLDILEGFLNLYGHTYLRLDGSTHVTQRQKLTERFNRDPKLFVFILSTRSGGLGINLTGADTVIFYDSDWNPAMDAQAQDRCHRIGQTREVHIYRLVSEHTIEENILKKANQKRQLDDVIIKGGGFTTEFFRSVPDIRDLLQTSREEQAREMMSMDFIMRGGGAAGRAGTSAAAGNISEQDLENAVLMAEDETDRAALRMAQREQAEELREFDESVALTESSAAAIGSSSSAISASASSSSSSVHHPQQHSSSSLSSSYGGGGGGDGEGQGQGSYQDQDVTDTYEDNPSQQDMHAQQYEDDPVAEAARAIDERLMPIERYALRFLENLQFPPAGSFGAESHPSLRLSSLVDVGGGAPGGAPIPASASAPASDPSWSLEAMAKLKEQEDARMEDDDEMLYYEVPTS